MPGDRHVHVGPLGVTPDYTPSLKVEKNVPADPQGPPKDPRLEYPRVIATPRKRGEGCSSCKWRPQCRVMYWNQNFGNTLYVFTEQSYSPNLNSGHACESWNYPFDPLPPGTFEYDGLGLGNPFATGDEPKDIYNPYIYVGQLPYPVMGGTGMDSANTT